MDYKAILKRVSQIRHAEKLLLEEFRKGKIRGTIHASIGQEYAPVIMASVLPDSMWFSNHRGHAHYLAKTQDFGGFFGEILGKECGVNKGYGGSQHFYVPNFFISNGIQGGQLGIAIGYASEKNKNQTKTVIFIGDGTLGAGHVYESLNIGSLFKSKTLIILEDNEIAQSTPSNLSFSGNVKQRVEGFGCKYFSWESSEEWNSSLEQLHSICVEAAAAIEHGPAVFHLKVARLGSHSKGDDNRPRHLIEQLLNQDFLNQAMECGYFSESESELESIEAILEKVTASKAAESPQKPEISSMLSKEIHKYEEKRAITTSITQKESINEALAHAIENSDALLLGEDIEDYPFKDGAQYGGAFKVTEGLSERFPNNVKNMPVSESGFVGFAIGCAMSGRLIIAEIMFSDFLTQCADQIIHQLSKIPTMYGTRISIPLVIRTASGPGRGYGPTHSHTMENLLVNLPNITVASLSPFSDYKKLINLVVSQKTPLIIFEPKTVYNFQVIGDQFMQYSLVAPKNVYDPIYLVPKFKSADFTVVCIGDAATRILRNLEKLFFEEDILLDVFMPTIISEFEDSRIIESLNRTKGLLIATDSLGANGFFSNWILESQIYSKTTRIEEYKVTDWLPNGILEDGLTLNFERLVALLGRLKG